MDLLLDRGLTSHTFDTSGAGWLPEQVMYIMDWLHGPVAVDCGSEFEGVHVGHLSVRCGQCARITSVCLSGSLLSKSGEQASEKGHRENVLSFLSHEVSAAITQL